MKRAIGPEFLESIANHPRVIRNIGCKGEQFTAGESWKDSIGLEWPDGGLVFHRSSPGVYSVHIVFAPKAKDVADKCRDAFRYMFTRTPAHTLTGKVPMRLRHVRNMAIDSGMNHLFDCDGYAFYRLTAREWIKHKRI